MAAASPGARARGVIAWDPVPRGRDYLMHLLRSTIASEFARSGAAPTRAALLRSLEAGETVVVDGYGIGPALYRDLVAVDWKQLADSLPCPLAAMEGASDPVFWRESKRMHARAPHMSERTRAWLREQAS
jgi:hypothetical protein